LFDLSGFTKSFLKATNGSYAGRERMQNLTQVVPIYGYAEINNQATSSFGRLKVHRGWFACELELVKQGDLVEDTADQSKYFVMSIKKECNDGVSVYLDATLYFCNCTATISRFTSGLRDTFGRSVIDSFIDVNVDIPIMTNPKNSESTEFPDRFIETDKIQVYLQAVTLVQEADRITTSQGDVYKINTIDKNSLTGIWICSVNKDDR
jgi:hypothetical protein